MTDIIVLLSSVREIVEKDTSNIDEEMMAKLKKQLTLFIKKTNKNKLIEQVNLDGSIILKSGPRSKRLTDAERIERKERHRENMLQIYYEKKNADPSFLENKRVRMRKYRADVRALK